MAMVVTSIADIFLAIQTVAGWLRVKVFVMGVHAIVLIHIVVLVQGMAPTQIQVQILFSLTLKASVALEQRAV